MSRNYSVVILALKFFNKGEALKRTVEKEGRF